MKIDRVKFGVAVAAISFFPPAMVAIGTQEAYAASPVAVMVKFDTYTPKYLNDCGPFGDPFWCNEAGVYGRITVSGSSATVSREFGKWGGTQAGGCSAAGVNWSSVSPSLMPCVKSVKENIVYKFSSVPMRSPEFGGWAINQSGLQVMTNTLWNGKLQPVKVKLEIFDYDSGGTDDDVCSATQYPSSFGTHSIVKPTNGDGGCEVTYKLEKV